MAITLRNTKGSELTFAELDGNFTHLDNKIDSDLNVLETNIDSDIAALQSEVDSNFTHFTDITDSIGSASHIQAKQIKYNTADFLDSNTVALVVDSAYVNARVNLANSLDSAEVIALIDSSYIQARQLTFDFMDSAEVINLIDSAYVLARSPSGIDSAAVTAMIDSDYIESRVSTVTFETYTVATAPASGVEGQVIYVSDGDAGSACLAIWSGGQWTVVSTLGSAIGDGGGGGGF